MDMTSQQMDNSILEAFSILTDSALENAEFDKTIRAVIYSCQDESLGYYKVQHQDSILNAYAIDPSVRYSKGTAVIVHIPKGDSTAKKTILGSVSQLGTEYVQDLIEGAEIFDVSGNLLENIKTGVFPIGLKKLESEIDITNYFSKSENLFCSIASRISCMSFRQQQRLCTDNNLWELSSEDTNRCLRYPLEKVLQV